MAKFKFIFFSDLFPDFQILVDTDNAEFPVFIRIA